MALALKRLFDFLVALVCLVLFSPLLLIVALAIWRTMGRPVTFRQTRPGYRGKPFVLTKFRTMREAYDPEGKPLSDGERLTALGTFIRKTSLDELPQLWNVLKGEMSLVGPRPLLMHYLELYTPEQARRHDVRPGITGWAQINGRNAIDWEQKFAYDVWYVDHWSLLLDLQILFTTLKTVLARQDISQPGAATVEEFKGSPRSS